jgi:hypothetical protein
MAQAGFTPIQLYFSTTAAAVPLAANLAQGELAINIVDGKLYYENNSGVVTLLASTAGASGDVVGPASSTDNAIVRFDSTTGKLIQNSVGILSDAGVLTGLTGLTSSGSITFSGLTSGRVTFAGTGGLLSDSANLTWDGTTLGVVGRLYNGSASTFGASTWGMSLGNGGVSANYFKASTTYWQDDAGTAIMQLGLNSLALTGTGNTNFIASTTSTTTGAYAGFKGSGDPTLQIGQFSASNAGTTFGLSNANLSFLYTTTYATGHSSALVMGTAGSTPIVFATTSTEAARFLSSGFFGIGTSNPITKFVVSNAGAEGLEVSPSGGAVSLTAYNRSGGAYAPISLIGSGGGTLKMGSTGGVFNTNVGINTSTSALNQSLNIDGSGGTLAGTAAISFWDANSGGSRRWAIANGASAAGTNQIGVLTFSSGTGSFTADPLTTGFEIMRLTGSPSMNVNQTFTTGTIGVGLTDSITTFSSLGYGMLSLTNKATTNNNYTWMTFNESSANYTGAIGVQNVVHAGASSTVVGEMVFATKQAGVGGFPSERVRIKSTGQFLVGTTSTSTGAKIYAGGGGGLYMEQAGNGGTGSPYQDRGYLYGPNDVNVFAGIRFTNEYLGNVNTGMQFWVTNGAVGSATEAGRFIPTGYFKASNTATYADTAGLYHEFRGNSANSYVVIVGCTNATPLSEYIQDWRFTAASPNDGNARFWNCEDSTANRAYMRSNGGLSNYQANDTNLSDRREKTNFASAGSYLDKICAIPVQTFNYIDQNFETDDGLTLGVVAQDVQAVAPELVSESNWGTKEEPKMRLSIYQTDLQYALMKCIQELKAEFDAYKASHP